MERVFKKVDLSTKSSLLDSLEKELIIEQKKGFIASQNSDNPMEIILEYSEHQQLFHYRRLSEKAGNNDWHVISRMPLNVAHEFTLMIYESKKEHSVLDVSKEWVTFNKLRERKNKIDFKQLKNEIAQLQEQSYRRGLQHGVVLSEAKKIDNNKAVNFRFDFPLEHLNPLNPKKGENHLDVTIEERLKMEINGYKFPNLAIMFFDYI